TDKTLAKAARKALHVLRTRGVAAPVAPVKAVLSADSLRVPEAEVDCLASSIDGGGERAIWLARAESQGVAIFEAYVHEEHGITQFRSSEVSRKSYRNLNRELRGERMHFTIAPVPWSYARAEIELAYQRNQAAGRAIPVEFARARQQIGKGE